MDPPYALHGHPSSMSCPYTAAHPATAAQAVPFRGEATTYEPSANGVAALVTILPLSLDDSEWRPAAPSRLLSPRHVADEVLRASQIPLPPSAAGSEHSSQRNSQEKPRESPALTKRRSDVIQPASRAEKVMDSTRIPISPGAETHGQPSLSAPVVEPGEELDPIQIPLPASVAGSEGERLSLSQSRRSSLLSVRSHNPPIYEGQAVQLGHGVPNKVSPPDIIVPADSPTPGFEEVMNLVQLANHEHTRNLGLQEELLRLVKECGAQTRDLGMHSYLFKGLVECFRQEKKAAFATLFEQLETSKTRCLNSVTDSHDLNAIPSGSRKPKAVPWISTLPGQAQPALLKFLNSLRTNPLFLAERISALNSSQLKNLAKPHLHGSRTDSSTESSPNPRLDHRLLRPWTRNSSGGLENITQDPLRLMILNCFDSNSSQGYSERQRLLDVWSTACARLIEDQRTGSNEFCFAVLEVLAELTPWELGPQLELFLLELMHTGRFLTSSSQVTNAKDLTESSESSEPRISAFFDGAVDALLELVASSPSFSVPTVALHLIHATLEKLDDPQMTARARRFFVYTWYCNTFLSNALLHPERHRLLLNVHINPTVRQKLFRELASRVQRTVREVLDPRYNKPPTKSEAQVSRLSSIFDAKGSSDTARHEPVTFERPYLVLFAEDVLSIARALYPNDPSESNEKVANSEPTSPPSSVTGSSTLTAGTTDLRSGINSAFTPSISGTSVTSHTLSNDFFLKAPDKAVDKAAGSATKSRPGTSASLDGLADEPVHSFLSELWKLCASRKSSNSPPPSLESSIFFVETPSGRLNSYTSRNTEGTLQAYGPISESATSTASKDIQTVMRALSKVSSDKRFHRHPDIVTSPDACASIGSLFKLYLDQARCQNDYRTSFFWFHALRALNSLSPDEGETPLPDICHRYHANIQEYVSCSQLYQEWIHALHSLRASQERQLQHSHSHGAALRTKMWYVTDVRHSDAYEHTVNIVKALQKMVKQPNTHQQGVAAWARQRLKASWGHEKAQAQAFQLISASRTCGGPNKLTNDQSELISHWLTRESIENFCGGEERVHRFCFEIRRCASKLVGASMSESPVLWSSPLFNNGEKRRKDISKFRSEQDLSTVKAPRPASMDSVQPTANLFSRKGGLGFAFDRASNDLSQLGQDQLADPFTESSTRSRRGSNLLSPSMFPPSPVSPTGNFEQQRLEQATNTFVEQLRQRVVALLITDLGSEMWADGTETDGWINHGKTPLSTAAQSLGEQSDHVKSEDTQPQSEANASTFDFEEGYKKLLAIFKYSLDPQQKLQALYELSILAECQCISFNEPSYSGNKSDGLPDGIGGLVAQARGVPRIRLTRLQEVVANCNERRQSSRAVAVDNNGHGDLLPGNISSTPHDISNALAVVSKLFLDKQYRPNTLFRDLQLIASFVSSTTLDRTAHGTVFWTVGLVAMGLKSETCKIMTRRATEIVDYHVNSSTTNRNRSKEPMRAAQPSDGSTAVDPTLTDTELAATTLADAARFYLLSALEGEPSAARELALFYLTHPELVRPAMLPLSRPGEVLRSINLLGGASSNERRSAEGGAAGVLDPPTFAIAYHWMEFAANAGDADAQTFLLENRELAGGA